MADITIILTSPTSYTLGTALATDSAAVHYTADSSLTSARQLVARTNIDAVGLGTLTTAGDIPYASAASTWRFLFIANVFSTDRSLVMRQGANCFV